MRVLSLSLLFLSLLSACGGEGDYFFVRSGEADLPVWVRGNTGSGTFLVLLHGGPGYSALREVGTPAFEALEERYAVVYWDQRASGTSQGNVDATTLTLEQFVTDTDRVMETLGLRYPSARFFLLGHSWGGQLGTAWLLDPARQAKVRGWVEVDGSHDVVEGYRLSREWMLRYSAERLAAGEETPWREARDWYEAHPALTLETILQHSGYVHRAGGYSRRAPPTSSQSVGEQLFTSPFNRFAHLYNNPTTAKAFDIYGSSLTADMGRITLPSLVLWGRHDGILPPELATQAYQALGTPEAHKSLVFFEDSAHSPHEDEPERFVSELSTFIERYR
jgi:pimeloyl-ACP methyl ester carboxylesterase